ncbi:hypothetical protein E6W17_15520 [Streptomyces sp. A1547]|nr:hypothetical protein E6W17_15520 [Streptomyces sp. A1547]
MSTAPDHSCVHKRMHGQMHVHAEGAPLITVREELGWIRGESDAYKDWIKAQRGCAGLHGTPFSTRRARARYPFRREAGERGDPP